MSELDKKLWKILMAVMIGGGVLVASLEIISYVIGIFK